MMEIDRERVCVCYLFALCDCSESGTVSWTRPLRVWCACRAGRASPLGCTLAMSSSSSCSSRQRFYACICICLYKPKWKCIFMLLIFFTLYKLVVVSDLHVRAARSPKVNRCISAKELRMISFSMATTWPVNSEHK